jgi:hypothetical protein
VKKHLSCRKNRGLLFFGFHFCTGKQSLRTRYFFGVGFGSAYADSFQAPIRIKAFSPHPAVSRLHALPESALADSRKSSVPYRVHKL